MYLNIIICFQLENFENDRVKWQQREADLYNQIRSISAGNGEPRTPRRRSITSNSLNGMNVQQYGSSLGNICEILTRWRLPRDALF